MSKTSARGEGAASRTPKRKLKAWLILKDHKPFEVEFDKPYWSNKDSTDWKYVQCVVEWMTRQERK